MTEKKHITSRELAKELGLSVKSVASVLAQNHCPHIAGHQALWEREAALDLLGRARAAQAGLGSAGNAQNLGEVSWPTAPRQRAPGSFPGSIEAFRQVAREFREKQGSFWG